VRLPGGQASERGEEVSFAEEEISFRAPRALARGEEISSARAEISWVQTPFRIAAEGNFT
jgi:hypothetical protein